MNNKHVFYHPRCGVALLALLMAAGLAHAEEPSFHLGGYLRMGASFNLQDAPETAGDDRGKLSMLRGTLLLDADADAGPLRIKGVARAVREMQRRLAEEWETRDPGLPYRTPYEALIMASIIELAGGRV
ncbi:MAG: hypothetical protein CVU28_02840, partial [Betaproteobacteria bacterium HGW-Betaproteobacteria-21]